MSLRTSALLLMAAVAVGCGGEGGQSGGAAEEAAPAAMTAAPTSSQMEAPTGEIDAALATSGEAYFQSRGCGACHMVTDARMVGPGLKGITQRREYDWFMGMVLRPDSMLQNDPVAKQLLQEYGTPMVYMGTTQEEARAIYEYLRRESQ
jgi:mono/diheme cytochrome c family protein